ncbi:MAG: phenylalanine--tRNA ligase subunit beta [Gammaproteobacteria bacterium]|nr:phenylalanine--tRNA ligase subunit beta [Gammaproteobacteria bacterium]|tara:strand:- start:39946 stop:41973 length:2028 start_codon:yes stop_codon:yes gene_type:complete
MKVSVNWLSEFLEPLKRDKKLSHKMTSLGLEVSRIQQLKSDKIIDLDITPNRSDCLSVYGVARDLKTLYKTNLKPLKRKKIIKKSSKNKHIKKINHTISPIYSCFEIRNLNNRVSTPLIIKQRLKNCGISSVNLLVDILNYSMIEIGQPFHAFDLNLLEGPINIRFSKPGEYIDALNEKHYKLMKSTPVISDSKNIQAIAGLIGSNKSAITKDTKDVLIECAYFVPDLIRQSSKTYKLQTDSSYRFERGVDPTAHIQALEIVLNLIYKYSNYDSYNFSTNKNLKKTNKDKSIITTDLHSFQRILGLHIKLNTIKRILSNLNFIVKIRGNKILVQAPCYRFDISNEYDLFEEVARVIGYQNFDSLSLPPFVNSSGVKNKHEDRFSSLFVTRGYREVINYTFLPKFYQEHFNKKDSIISIDNPISEDKCDMRISMIPGLIKSYKYNYSRQNPSMKIFENGKVYFQNLKSKITEKKSLAGLISGSDSNYALKEDSINYNFFDIKGDLLSILPNIKFRSIKSNNLLNKRCQAEIIYNGKVIGYCGEISKKFYELESIKPTIYVFELFTEMLDLSKPIVYKKISPFPKIRRDLSLILDKNLKSQDIINLLERERFKYLINIKITDIFYNSKEFSENEKSVSLEFVFQDMNTTLKDSQVTDQINRILELLKKRINAKLRDK